MRNGYHLKPPSRIDRPVTAYGTHEKQQLLFLFCLQPSGAAYGPGLFKKLHISNLLMAQCLRHITLPKTYCMPWNQLIGTDGETRVRQWLASKGFRLINFGWNSSYGEIDIIASFLDQLHIIAVTTKTFAQYGLPAEGITRKKMLSCKQAAQQYLERHPRWKKVIFDVMAISPTENDQEIILLKDIQTA